MLNLLVSEEKSKIEKKKLNVTYEENPVLIHQFAAVFELEMYQTSDSGLCLGSDSLCVKWQKAQAQLISFNCK